MAEEKKTVKVSLNNPFESKLEKGAKENHWGVPFVSDGKGDLLAELPADEAKAMIDAGRVKKVGG